ncbi:bifunctional diaminohydroxyphosphoribosylaminopyrimidine deaminase/5-amino-6-(5-phosphoribosylamino)uracil reductase RibD [candidate division KSB1 bacterium]
MKNLDEKYMIQALELARLGGRAVAPNPMVGAVIVKDGKIIGKGYHQKFGGPHAEVLAIQSVKRKADLEGSTMYVTMTPCRHFGKTPPCQDFVEVMGISRIVVGMKDPFRRSVGSSQPLVQCEYLKGEVADECKWLNKFFFKWVESKRPYVTVKIAMSADGFVARVGSKSVRFTTKKQDAEIHQLRAQHQAIMVGINTVLNDNPQLTVRLAKGEDPLRVILDSRFSILDSSQVFKDENYLIATCRKGAYRGLNVWVSPTKKQVSLKKLFHHLAQQGISSVLVEPGPILYQSLKKQGLIDELAIYVGKKKLGKGLKIGL